MLTLCTVYYLLLKVENREIPLSFQAPDAGYESEWWEQLMLHETTGNGNSNFLSVTVIANINA